MTIKETMLKFLKIENIKDILTKNTKKTIKQEENSSLIKKETDKIFIKDIKYKNLNRTPVFLVFFSLILVANILIFFTILAKNSIGNLKTLDSQWFQLFFGANHASSVFTGKQVWRIVSYAFIENVNGFQILISAIFIWITFYSVGFYQEVFLGSKQSLIIWGGGILIIGLTQIFLTKTEAVYYYGTEYLSWLAVGSLLFLLFSQTVKNEQAQSLIKRNLLRVVIFLILFGILKYVEIQKTLNFNNDNVMRVGGYYITFTFLSVCIGFFLALLLNYRKLDSIIAIYSVVIFFTILLIILIGIGTWGVTQINIGSTSWEKIKPYY